MFDKNSKIYISGHTGLLGSAILRQLKKDGYRNILVKSHKELDLINRTEVEKLFKENEIEYVFLCVARVGGILSNKNYPATYLHENLAIQNNVFELANKYKVKNLIFYGSSCTYPKDCTSAIKEEDFLTGVIEETSMGYASAKIAGIVACKSYNIQYDTNRFICLIPNTMYGQNDNFNLENCHVFSALIKRFHVAKKNKDKTITLWGSGEPRREFVFSEDIAKASIFMMKNSHLLENTHYNIGMGVDYSIKELALLIAKVVGYKGEILWDKTKPDGVKRKFLDSSKFLSLGGSIGTSLENGIKITYEWYKEWKNEKS